MTRIVGALALALALSACGGSPVTIKTASGDCYTSGTTGELVTDPTWGVAIVEDRNVRRIAVDWPTGWTGRSSGSEVEVLNRKGEVAARTGTHVNLMGGYWYVDHSFLVCALEPIS